MNSDTTTFRHANELLRKKNYEAASSIYRALTLQQPSFKPYRFWLDYCFKKLSNHGDVPVVSIIMPTFNRSGVVGLAIDSVLNQNFFNWELIVVDDGSTDETSLIMSRYIDDERISYFKESRSGVSSARNAGLRQARGEYIAYLDSDNRWEPDYLHTMLSAMSYAQARVAYSGTTNIKQNGDRDYRFVQFDLNRLREKNYIDLNVFMHRREIFESLGGFDPELYRMVDWDLILKYCTQYNPLALDFNGCAYSDGDDPQRITNSVKSPYLAVKHRYSPIVDWGFETTKKRVLNRISIIIPFIDNPALTIDCFKSIKKNHEAYDVEVVLVDNGSPSECADAVKRELKFLSDDRFKYVRHASNLNFSLGNNTGFAKSSGEFVVFLNNDTTVTKGWLQPLITILSGSNEVGYVQPLLLYPDGVVQGGIVAFSSFSAVPYHLYSGSSPEDPFYAKGRNVSAATAACLMVRASDFIVLKGFDPIFVNGCEDTDLCLRFKRDLKKIGYFEPASKVFHHESKSEGRMDYFNTNRLALCTRWKNDYVADDVQHMKLDGYFPVAYQPKEGLIEGFPWVRRIDNPKLESLESLRQGKFKLLVVKPSGIGNMVMFLPALTAIKKKYPGASISILCFKAEGMFVNNYVDDVIVIARSIDGRVSLKEVDDVLAGRFFDIVIYPPYTGIAEPTGALHNVSPIHVTHPFVTFESRHETSHNIDMALMLGADHRDATFPCVEFETTEVVNTWGRYAVVHVGSSSSKHMMKKRWPNDRWALLVDYLAAHYDHVLFVGGGDDVQDVESVTKQVSKQSLKKIVALVNSKSFLELINIIGSAEIFISNDSGLMHLASMTSVKMISIFGPTNPVKNKPWRTAHCVVLTPQRTTCSPCYTNSAKILNACTRQICLESITVDQVIAAEQNLVKN